MGMRVRSLEDEETCRWPSMLLVAIHDMAYKDQVDRFRVLVDFVQLYDVLVSPKVKHDFHLVLDVFAKGCLGGSGGPSL